MTPTNCNGEDVRIPPTRAVLFKTTDATKARGGMREKGEDDEDNVRETMTGKLARAERTHGIGRIPARERQSHWPSQTSRL